jgi:hypothetical protein
MSLAPSMLLLGLAVAAPALWASLVEQELPVDVALQRFVIILLVISVGGSALRALFDTYTRTGPASGHSFHGDADRRQPAAGRSDNPRPPAV